MEAHALFAQASVVESMLVALNHMQVNVCTFEGREDSRTGLTRFRKNIISFPQRLSELQQHLAFVDSVVENDILNVVTGAATVDGAPRTVQRARVREVRPDGFLVEIYGEQGLREISKSDVQARVRLPWKPNDLRHALIVLRRRNRNRDEYVEDLRVRPNFVVALLRCLSQLGHWRENRDEEPMHMYYTEFDWLEDDEIATVLPEDGVPDTLHIEDLDEEEPTSGMTLQEFQDWIWEGRHDCEVAQAMLRMWVGALRATGSDTLGDFYNQLLFEHREQTASL